LDKRKPKPSGLHKGDRVVMHTCYEASLAKNKDVIWTVDSEPWDLCGCEVVLLEGYRGGFATQYLRKVTEHGE
jgi:hypothetical protein